MNRRLLRITLQITLTAVLLLLSSFAFSRTDGGINGAYPMGPDATLTPGSLCTTPNQFRYPERIAYCSRNVDHVTKQDAFRLYDEQLGYQTRSMNRQDFKIDHLIPLCMGGSNQIENLWPQHKEVYNLTDPLEGLACEKMAQGRLRQRTAIEKIMRAKHDHTQIDAVMQELKSL